MADWLVTLCQWLKKAASLQKPPGGMNARLRGYEATIMFPSCLLRSTTVNLGYTTSPPLLAFSNSAAFVALTAIIAITVITVVIAIVVITAFAPHDGASNAVIQRK